MDILGRVFGAMMQRERFTKRCSLELNEYGVRRRVGWLPRNSKLIFLREPNYPGWTTRWFALLIWDEGQFITVPVLTQVFLVVGSSSPWTVDATWNNANNSVDVIGAGGSGAAGATGHITGGGGGAWNQVTNLTLGATAAFGVGTGGAGVSGVVAGNPGTRTWFNGATYAASSVGADNGVGGVLGSGSRNGGAGGLVANNIPATGKAGGRGGNLTGASGNGASGGGGAGGPNAAGNNGGDSSSTSNVNTDGGQGDGTSGGAGSTGVGGTTNPTNSNPGSDGQEYDSTHGSGGGSGACGNTGGNPAHSGSGGKYGAGTGGGAGASGTSSGDAGDGLIALTWTVVPPYYTFAYGVSLALVG